MPPFIKKNALEGKIQISWGSELALSFLSGVSCDGAFSDSRLKNGDHSGEGVYEILLVQRVLGY